PLGSATPFGRNGSGHSRGERKCSEDRSAVWSWCWDGCETADVNFACETDTARLIAFRVLRPFRLKILLSSGPYCFRELVQWNGLAFWRPDPIRRHDMRVPAGWRGPQALRL